MAVQGRRGSPAGEDAAAEGAGRGLPNNQADTSTAERPASGAGEATPGNQSGAADWDDSAWSTARAAPSTPSRAPRPSSTLRIANLSPFATEDDVEDLIAARLSSSPPVAVKLLFNERTGLCKGLCFVDFGSLAAADEALKTLQGADIKGEAIQLSYSPPIRPDVKKGFQKDERPR